MKRLLLAALITLVAGCSQLAQTPATADRFDPKAAAALQNWSAEGRLGIRMQRESHSANLDWQQQGDEYRIALTGPLGQGGLRIEGDSRYVSLRQAGEEKIHRAATPEALMQQLLGWHLPLSHARYWIRGLADPGAVSTPLNAPAVGFVQAGWTVEYLRFAPAAGQLLPEKLRLQHKDLRLTVIINDWEAKAGQD